MMNETRTCEAKQEILMKLGMFKRPPLATGDFPSGPIGNFNERRFHGDVIEKIEIVTSRVGKNDFIASSQ